MSVFLSVSIDCECDKGPGWRLQKPLRFQGIFEGVLRRLEPLFRAHGGKATYLLSPEVIADERSVEALRSLNGNAELGTHLHGEFAYPDAFEPEVTSVFQREYSHETEEAKLTSLTTSFVSTFGHAPASFRAGRFGIGPSSLGILESLGYKVESSVTPHIEWANAGAPGLDFRGAPTQPYHPARSAPHTHGDSPLLEVPVTIRKRLVNKLPFVGKVFEPRWLRPTRTSGQALVDLAKDEIAAARAASRDRPVVLNAMLHNVEVVAGASPYAQTEREAARILERLGTLLSFARSEGIKVIGLADVPAVLHGS